MMSEENGCRVNVVYRRAYRNKVAPESLCSEEALSSMDSSLFSFGTKELSMVLDWDQPSISPLPLSLSVVLIWNQP